ncbi:30S ribosomal protein S20 [Chloracidobacterium sp. MS 40/45]|uniref:30S ribosomal protein S20 n=1 Tax=Chloracidobacterium aggregatum TaxID=2851959 RepID=UPI001B8D7546|nr:30S ribosomal protein S20 [Chloracidobacterium aggregatum]QUV99636.1 30S ribosomal protein S20 [Chloracidobacterium sp. MS 40/45]
MPNKASAIKRVRQTERRNAVNRRNRSRLRTFIKKLRAALRKPTAEDLALVEPKKLSGVKRKTATGLQKVYLDAISVIDKSVQKGIIHHNTAARYKSRLWHRIATVLSQHKAGGTASPTPNA